MRKSWDERAQDLLEFHRQHGHFNVPSRIPGESTTNMLYCWMKKLRTWHDQGNKPTTSHLLSASNNNNTLTQDRVDQLNALGFPWEVKRQRAKSRTTTTKTWDERAQELIEFHQQHGHFNVPPTGESGSLRSWMRRLREWHDGEQEGNKLTNNHRPSSALTQERVEELNALGFPWKVKTRAYNRRVSGGSDEARWQKRLQELRDFKLEHGHTNVPCRLPENVSFGYWVVTVRKTFRRVKKGEETTFLTSERIIELDNLGFPWAVPFGLPNSEKYNEEQIRQEEKENISFIKNIKMELSKKQHPQEQRHEAQTLAAPSENEISTQVGPAKKPVPPTALQPSRKRKKDKQKVQCKKKKKLKTSPEIDNIQMPSNKKEIKMALSKQQQPQQPQRHEAQTHVATSENEIGTQVAPAKKPVPPTALQPSRKRKKDKQKVQCEKNRNTSPEIDIIPPLSKKKRKKKKKRKNSQEGKVRETTSSSNYLVDSTNKKQRKNSEQGETLAAVREPRNESDKAQQRGNHQKQKQHGSESENVPSSSRPQKEIEEQCSLPMAKARETTSTSNSSAESPTPPPFTALRNSVEQQPPNFGEATIIMMDGSHQHQQQKKKPSLGERLRAKYDARCIFISL